MKRIVCLICCLLCAVCCLFPACAEGAEECRCFSAEVFASAESELTGICITRLPEPEVGTVILGSRQLRPGDVVTAQQVSEITFVAGDAQEDGSASISYLPVFADGLAGEATTTFSFRSRENKPPIAEDSAFETYKNLEVTGALRVRDPEGQPMQFTVTRQPKRGTITIRDDGSFTYTPKKNKVGVDSFTFTAADPAGKISREATVTVTILKPTDSRQYSDTAGSSCRFAAEWMKNTGIFVGESLDGNPCFSPEKQVTRGELLTMLVKTLNLPTDAAITETGYEDAPAWLKPYLAAAVRSGLIAAMPARDTFGYNDPVTAEETASLLCAALELDSQNADVSDALAIAEENGFCLTSGTYITRADTAQLLYQASKLVEEDANSDF